MEKNFKESMNWLHTWSGLIVGWLLFTIFVTGTSAYYKDEINTWMKPEFHKALVSENAIQIAINKAIENIKTSNKVSVSLPNSRTNVISIRVEKTQIAKQKKERKGRTLPRYYDASSGKEIKETTKTAGGDFLYRFHFELYGISKYLGRWIVGIASMIMFVAIISGILIHKRIFKDIFTFRPENNTRGWMNAHILPAVAALPFLIMITYSGLVLFGNIMFPHSMKIYYDNNFMKLREDYMALQINTNYNSNKSIKTNLPKGITKNKPNENNLTNEKLSKIIAEANNTWPNNIGGFNISKIEDRYIVEVTTKNPNTIFSTKMSRESITYDANTAEVLKQSNPPLLKSTIINTNAAIRVLHEARFANSTLRFFFFLSGILGTVVAGTGLILWIQKRKKKNITNESFGFWLIEKLNIGTIVGLFIAIGIFFIANRVLTVEENTRRALEINIFFVTWLLAYIHAFIRVTSKAWKEQLLFAAIVFAIIPFINALTIFDSFTQIFNRDNIFIFFDIFSFFMASIFILIRFILIKIERRKV